MGDDVLKGLNELKIGKVVYLVNFLWLCNYNPIKVHWTFDLFLISL